MKIRVVSIGKDRSGLFEPAVLEYAGRLKKQGHVVELIELKEGKSAEDEGVTIIGKVDPKSVLVCLDERGKEFTSVEIARKIGGWRDEGRDLLFAIGGDEGHAQAIRDRAQLVWGLGKLTLPHRLARVVLVEQIYRAMTILRGEPYHRGT